MDFISEITTKKSPLRCEALNLRLKEKRDNGIEDILNPLTEDKIVMKQQLGEPDEELQHEDVDQYE